MMGSSPRCRTGKSLQVLLPLHHCDGNPNYRPEELCTPGELVVFRDLMEAVEIMKSPNYFISQTISTCTWCANSVEVPVF